MWSEKKKLPMHSHMKWKCVGIKGRHSHDSQVEIHFGSYEFEDVIYIWINIWGTQILFKLIAYELLERSLNNRRLKWGCIPKIKI
jgi:hypothetical protein